jgi:hypothetical protein
MESTGIIVDIVRATTGGSLAPIPKEQKKKKKEPVKEEPQDSALWLAENELMKVITDMHCCGKTK